MGPGALSHGNSHTPRQRLAARITCDSSEMPEKTSKQLAANTLKFQLPWWQLLVGRAGFEPATLRFLHVSLVGWVTPTTGRHLQRLRQLKSSDLGWLGSSARLSYRPTEFLRWTKNDLYVSYQQSVSLLLLLIVLVDKTFNQKHRLTEANLRSDTQVLKSVCQLTD